VSPAAAARGAPIRSFLALRRTGRKPAIGRVNDQRRAFRSHNLVAAVVPKLIVGNDAARRVLSSAFLRIDQVTRKARGEIMASCIDRPPVIEQALRVTAILSVTLSVAVFWNSFG
jgi:hypothetical protein